MNETNRRNSAFEVQAEVFDRVFCTNRKPKTQAKALIASVAKQISCPSFIELGCGSGEVCRTIAASGCQVVGVDRSRQMIALAVSRSKKCGPLWVCKDFMIDEIEGNADAVLLLYSILESFETRELQVRCLEVAKNLARPGGLVLVECRNTAVSDSLFPAGAVFESIVEKTKVESWNLRRSEDIDELHLRIFLSPDMNSQVISFAHRLFRFDRTRLGKLLRAVDLEVEQWIDAPSFLSPFDPMDSTAMLVISRVP